MSTGRSSHVNNKVLSDMWLGERSKYDSIELDYVGDLAQGAGTGRVPKLRPRRDGTRPKTQAAGRDASQNSGFVVKLRPRRDGTRPKTQASAPSMRALTFPTARPTQQSDWESRRP